MAQVVNFERSLQAYYASLESRLGYQMLLGGTRHFGYYDHDTVSPFPIHLALRRMEDHLFLNLNVPTGSTVLDAGCGLGHVAAHLASKGLRVYGVDIIYNHIRWAREYIKSERLQNSVTIKLLDYHDLSYFHNDSFDAVYTMESLVHATDAKKVLGEFFRILKPGGSIALYEYDHLQPRDIAKQTPRYLSGLLERINKAASMPANETFSYGVLPSLLEENGFNQVEFEDLSQNIRPMLLLFYILAYIPFLMISILGLQSSFINTQAGVAGYQALRHRVWRYVAFTARKPQGKEIPHELDNAASASAGVER